MIKKKTRGHASEVEDRKVWDREVEDRKFESRQIEARSWSISFGLIRRRDNKKPRPDGGVVRSVLGEKSIARVDLPSPEGGLFSTALQCTYSESSGNDDGRSLVCQRSGRRRNVWRTRSSKKSRARRARLKVLAT